MKKTTLLIIGLLMAADVAKAQDIVTEFQHENGKYFNFHNIVEADDNTLLINCPMFEMYGSGPEYGSMFYKISMEGVLLDSLLVSLDDVPLRTFFEPVPGINGQYLYGRFERAGNDSTTVLRMTFIDENLSIINEKSVLLGDYQGHAILSTSDMFIDPNGDIIASFVRNKCIHMLRIGIDGELKFQRQLPELGYSLSVQVRHTGVYSEHPLRYSFLGGRMTSNFVSEVHVLDSLFEEVEVHSYNNLTTQPTIRFVSGMQEHLAMYDESSYFYTSRATGTINNQTHFYTALARYDRSHNLLGYKLFDEDDVNISPIKVTAVAPDTIYYSYMTTTGNNQLALACLDADLEIRWIRYVYDPDCFHWATTMTVLRDGKVAVGSYKYGQNPGRIFVVVVHDKLWDVDEKQFVIRPYSYYPNPSQTEIHLQYSPDVTPQNIELYDMQGRLLRSKRNNLESLNLQGLASGTYTMRVTLEGGNVFSDKVIKE